MLSMMLHEWWLRSCREAVCGPPGWVWTIYMQTMLALCRRDVLYSAEWCALIFLQPNEATGMLY